MKWKLINEQPNFAERIEEALHLLFPKQEIIVEATNTYTKRIIRVEVNAVFHFVPQINNIPWLPSALQKTYLHLKATSKTRHFT